MKVDERFLCKMTQLAELLHSLLNRRVSWTDKKGNTRFGTLREIRQDHLVVEAEQYGIAPAQKVRLKFDAAHLERDGESGPDSHVTHSLSKESNYQWKWEIRIDGDLWRKRRGFKSARTANESLRINLLEAFDVARNLHPSAEAIAASYLWHSDFMKSRLGPADFHDRLSDQKKHLCRSLIEKLKNSN
jgi:hypothetical protein